MDDHGAEAGASAVFPVTGSSRECRRTTALLRLTSHYGLSDG